MVHISALQSSTAYKEVAPMASVHCENESHSILQHKYDVVFYLPHKSSSSGQFPSTLPSQLQKLHFALLQGYRSSDDQPIALNAHFYQEANVLLVGWLPG